MIFDRDNLEFHNTVGVTCRATNVFSYHSAFTIFPKHTLFSIVTPSLSQIIRNAIFALSTTKVLVERRKTFDVEYSIRKNVKYWSYVSRYHYSLHLVDRDATVFV